MKAAYSFTEKDVVSILSEPKVRRDIFMSLVKFQPYARYRMRKNRVSMGERLAEHILGSGLLSRKLAPKKIRWDKLAWEFIIQVKMEKYLKKRFALSNQRPRNAYVGPRIRRK